MKKIGWLFHPCFLALLLCAGRGWATDYYVATDGSESGDGSELNSWPTIRHALGRISGGDTILVKDGVYHGQSSTSASFADWVIIRAEHDYRAKLTNVDGGSGAIFIYTPGSAKIVIEGFVISNSHPSYQCGDREENYLVHFQDAQDLVLRNNIIFGNNTPGTCNELLKINRGDVQYYPKNIRIVGNLFYDHADAGGADMIDSVRPGEIDIFENIFFARNAPEAQSFITLKREVVASEIGILPRSPRYQVARNVFLNWDGKTDQAFVQFGEDGYDQYMITDGLIENNLMIGNSSRSMAGPIQLKGVRGVTVRANTVVGDLPGSAYGARIGTEGDNPQVGDIFFYNNIWSDPTGTMGDRFLNIYNDVDVSTIALDHNLFFNNSNPLPAEEFPAPADDPNLILGDPLIEKNHAGLILPVWDEDLHRFPSGSVTIREEFERLALTYGAISAGSPAIGAADPANMPPDDILGRPRDANPDVGAFELIGSEVDAGVADGESDAGGEDAGGDGGAHDHTDGDIAEDAGSDDDPGGKLTSCGCESGAQRGFLPTVLILLVAILGTGRRNRPTDC
jgi:hypothetical protein